ncbi:MAG TPA: alpha/beta hydrolase [Fluviicoccus sp.]|nr:alpha/beta hydrolase [Fluviicoccus sp.]
MSSILMIPGLHGSEPAHWQSWWEAKDPSVIRVHQIHWDHGDLERWSASIREAILASRGPVWLVAHSFGCLASVHAAAGLADRVAGAFLVAPADPERFGIPPERLNSALPFPSMLVASMTDPFLRLEKAFLMSRAWGSQFVNLGNVGHINTESGFGPWPQGRRLFRLFRSQHEPLETFRWKISA